MRPSEASIVPDSDYQNRVPEEDGFDSSARRVLEDRAGPDSNRSRPTGRGTDRTLLRWIGAVLLLIGLVMTVHGISVAMTPVPMPQSTGNFQQDAAAADAWFQAATTRDRTAFAYPALGLVLCGFGGAAISLGMVRPTYRYLARESSEAVEIASESVARGLAKGGFPGGPASGSAPAPLVKVKCKHCGYLDTEDATYCSACGQPL